MPKVGGGGTRGGVGVGSGVNRNFNMGLGGGAVAALAGLASWIQTNSPSIDSGIFSNPIPDIRRPSIFSTPSVSRVGPNVTTSPAAQRRRRLATTFPVTNRSAAEGIFVNPSDNNRLADDNINMFSVERGLERAKNIISPSGHKRTGYGLIRRQGEKKHRMRVERDLPSGTSVDFPSSDIVNPMVDEFMQDPANKTYIENALSGSLPFLTGSSEQEGLFSVFGHTIGKSIKEIQEETGQNAPDHLVGGELNFLERQMRVAGAEPRSYKEVMEWHIANNPEFAGYTLKDMIDRLGKPTKYWDI